MSSFRDDSWALPGKPQPFNCPCASWLLPIPYSQQQIWLWDYGKSKELVSIATRRPNRDMKQLRHEEPKTRFPVAFGHWRFSQSSPCCSVNHTFTTDDCLNRKRHMRGGQTPIYQDAVAAELVVTLWKQHSLLSNVRVITVAARQQAFNCPSCLVQRFTSRQNGSQYGNQLLVGNSDANFPLFASTVMLSTRNYKLINYIG